MTSENLIDSIKQALPGLLRDDPELRRWVLELTRDQYADRAQTDDRFDRVLAQLQRDREEDARKWDANNRRWEEHRQEFQAWQAEMKRLREEQARKAEEDARRWEEHLTAFNADQARLERLWLEQDHKWDEHTREFDAVHDEIMAQAKKFDRSIGALGARWGLQSEASFRNALAGILQDSFGVTVLHVNEFDDTGEVFGRPDQVELDIIIRNGALLILELKSSVDKAAMYSFERKARFYEKRHERTADRLIVVSPMIEPKALEVAKDLGIETYSDSLEVPA